MFMAMSGLFLIRPIKASLGKKKIRLSSIDSALAGNV